MPEYNGPSSRRRSPATTVLKPVLRLQHCIAGIESPKGFQAHCLLFYEVSGQNYMRYSLGGSYDLGCSFLANDLCFLNNNLCLLRLTYLTASFELVVMYTLKSGVREGSYKSTLRT